MGQNTVTIDKAVENIRLHRGVKSMLTAAIHIDYTAYTLPSCRPFLSLSADMTSPIEPDHRK